MIKSRYLFGYQGDAMGQYRRVKDMREDHDLTQRKIAEILGMSQPQYCLYEQGYRDWPTDVLIKLADLYDTSIDYLLGRTDNPNKYPQK